MTTILILSGCVISLGLSTLCAPKLVAYAKTLQE
ncbi:hypothetical protein DFP78_11375 [Photobacterium lutimaris]|nr:hypothetical protein DFP78_11375 [Photobacterium lutimaris]